MILRPTNNKWIPDNIKNCYCRNSKHFLSFMAVKYEKGCCLSIDLTTIYDTIIEHMYLSKGRYTILFKAIALTLACLMLANDIAWSDPSGPTRYPQSATLAAESRLKPFFEKHDLEFKNLATVISATIKLRNLFRAGEVRESHIVRLNSELREKLRGDAIEIGTAIETGKLASGKRYSTAVLSFKKENKKISVLFLRDSTDSADLTAEDRAELKKFGVKTEADINNLDHPGLEGIWFMSPEKPLQSVSEAEDLPGGLRIVRSATVYDDPERLRCTITMFSEDKYLGFITLRINPEGIVVNSCDDFRMTEEEEKIEHGTILMEKGLEFAGKEARKRGIAPEWIYVYFYGTSWSRMTRRGEFLGRFGFKKVDNGLLNNSPALRAIVYRERNDLLTFKSGGWAVRADMLAHPGTQKATQSPSPVTSSPLLDPNTFSKETIMAVQEKLDGHIKRTPLARLERLSAITGKEVFAKDESVQIGNAFKARGVTYEVFMTIERAINEDPESIKKGLRIVTQTDGNHGAALIRAVTAAIKQYSEERPELANDLAKIEPVVFIINDVAPIKMTATDGALAEYRAFVGNNNKGSVIVVDGDYHKAVKDRELYIEEYGAGAHYMEHGGAEITQGHSTAAIEIAEQLKENGVKDDKKVCFIIPVGAGGPIGLAAVLKAFRKNVSVVMVQTPRYGAFVESYKSGKMCRNKTSAEASPFTIRIGGVDFIFEDGIAVDGPETLEVLEMARLYLDDAVLADPERALNKAAPIMFSDLESYYVRHGGGKAVVGGTTAITADALLNVSNKYIDQADVVVLFGTEGNVEPAITEHIRTRAQAKESAPGKNILSRNFVLATLGILGAIFITIHNVFPEYHLLGATNIQTFVGYIVFVVVGKIMAQVIDLRKDGNFRPSLKRDINWLQVGGAFLLMTVIFAWYWPGIYGLWLDHLPRYMIGGADLLITNPSSIFLMLAADNIIDRFSGKGKVTTSRNSLAGNVMHDILPKMRNGIIFSFVYWGIGIGIVASLPCSVSTQLLIFAGMEPLSIIMYYYLSAQKNEKPAQLKGSANYGTLRTFIHNFILSLFDTRPLEVRKWAYYGIPAAIVCNISFLLTAYLVANTAIIIWAMAAGLLLYVPVVLWGFTPVDEDGAKSSAFTPEETPSTPATELPLIIPSPTEDRSKIAEAPDPKTQIENGVRILNGYEHLLNDKGLAALEQLKTALKNYDAGSAPSLIPLVPTKENPHLEYFTDIDLPDHLFNGLEKPLTLHIQLNRGCYHQCAICQPAAGKKFEYMPYPIALKIADALAKRRGQNVVCMYGDDNDPMHYRDRYFEANFADVYKAFDDRNINIRPIATYGWSPNDKAAQQAGEELGAIVERKIALREKLTRERSNDIVGLDERLPLIRISYNFFTTEMIDAIKSGDGARIWNASRLNKEKYLRMMRAFSGKTGNKGKFYLLKEAPDARDFGMAGTPPEISQCELLQNIALVEIREELKKEGIEFYSEIGAIQWDFGRARRTLETFGVSPDSLRRPKGTIFTSHDSPGKILRILRPDGKLELMGELAFDIGQIGIKDSLDEDFLWLLLHIRSILLGQDANFAPKATTSEGFLDFLHFVMPVFYPDLCDDIKKINPNRVNLNSLKNIFEKFREIKVPYINMLIAHSKLRVEPAGEGYIKIKISRSFREASLKHLNFLQNGDYKKILPIGTINPVETRYYASNANPGNTAIDRAPGQTPATPAISDGQNNRLTRLNLKPMVFYELSSLLVLAVLSRSSTAIALVIIGIAAAGVLAMSRKWLAEYRAREMVRIFKDANSSYTRALAGLKTMAGVVTQMPKPPQSLSRSGVGLLDAYANTSKSFRNLVRDIRTMSRDRALRHLTREFLKLQDQEAVFLGFQSEVLRAVSDQAASGTVYPPSPIRHYRAAFTVLRHDLPRELWPVMDEVLSSAVQLKMLDADELKLPKSRRAWNTLPVTFADGGRAIFSRKYLERAVALRIIVNRKDQEPKVFEYSVKHERPVKPAGGISGLFGLSGKKYGVMLMAGAGTGLDIGIWHTMAGIAVITAIILLESLRRNRRKLEEIKISAIEAIPQWQEQNEEDVLKDFEKKIKGTVPRSDSLYDPLVRFYRYPLNNLGEADQETAVINNTKEQERELLKFWAEHFRLPEGYGGYAAVGRQQAELYAMLVARSYFEKDSVFYLSDQVDSLLYSALKILRVDKNRIKIIKSSPNGEIDYTDLEKNIRQSGGPAVVCLNAGRLLGAFDDLDRVKTILERNGIKQKYIHYSMSPLGIGQSFLNADSKIDFENGVDSMTLPLDRFAGTPIPGSIVLTKKENVHNISDMQEFVEYVNSKDTTVPGSRSGHSPLYLWFASKVMGTEGFRARAQRGLEACRYINEALNVRGYPCRLNEHNDMIIFEKPSDKLCREWGLLSYGSESYFEAIPYLSNIEIAHFVNAILKERFHDLPPTKLISPEDVTLSEAVKYEPSGAVLDSLARLEEKLRKYSERCMGFPVNIAASKDVYGVLKRFFKYILGKADAEYFRKEALGFFTKLYGVRDEDVESGVTAGGTWGNYIGLLAGRERFPDGILYYSEDSHYSVDKAARLLNMKVRKVPSLPNGEIDYAKLEEAIKANIDKPVILNLNIGTTMKGAIDRPDKVLDILKRNGIADYHIHCDAALSGMTLPFLDGAPKMDLTKDVHSVAISTHKFIGLPMTSGVFMIRKSCASEDLIKMTNDILTAQSGNVLLYLWHAVMKRGPEEFKKEAVTCIDNSEYLYRRLREIGCQSGLNKFSTTVIFTRPSQELIDKWQLAPCGDFVHIVVMQHVTREKIDAFIEELKTDMKSRNGASRMPITGESLFGMSPGAEIGDVPLGDTLSRVTTSATKPPKPSAPNMSKPVKNTPEISVEEMRRLFFSGFSINGVIITPYRWWRPQAPAYKLAANIVRAVKYGVLTEGAFNRSTLIKEGFIPVDAANNSRQLGGFHLLLTKKILYGDPRNNDSIVITPNIKAPLQQFVDEDEGLKQIDLLLAFLYSHGKKNSFCLQELKDRKKKINGFIYKATTLRRLVSYNLAIWHPATAKKHSHYTLTPLGKKFRDCIGQWIEAGGILDDGERSSKTDKSDKKMSAEVTSGPAVADKRDDSIIELEKLLFGRPVPGKFFFESLRKGRQRLGHRLAANILRAIDLGMLSNGDFTQKDLLKQGMIGKKPNGGIRFLKDYKILREVGSEGRLEIAPDKIAPLMDIIGRDQNIEYINLILGALYAHKKTHHRKGNGFTTTDLRDWGIKDLRYGSLLTQWTFTILASSHLARREKAGKDGLSVYTLTPLGRKFRDGIGKKMKAGRGIGMDLKSPKSSAPNITAAGSCGAMGNISDGDTTNPFIVRHIDDGNAIEINETDQKVAIINRGKHRPRDPPREIAIKEHFDSNGTFDKIARAKDAALLERILSKKTNFDSFDQAQKARLINAVRTTPLSIILSQVVIGKIGIDNIFAHARTGYTERTPELNPTIWIGEILFNRLSDEQLAELMLEEAQHIVRAPHEFDGIWFNLEYPREGAENPENYIHHDEDFINSMNLEPASADELERIAEPKTGGVPQGDTLPAAPASYSSLINDHRRLAAVDAFATDFDGVDRVAAIGDDLLTPVPTEVSALRSQFSGLGILNCVITGDATERFLAKVGGMEALARQGPCYFLTRAGAIAEVAYPDGRREFFEGENYHPASLGDEAVVDKVKNMLRSVTRKALKEEGLAEDIEEKVKKNASPQGVTIHVEDDVNVQEHRFRIAELARAEISIMIENKEIPETTAVSVSFGGVDISPVTKGSSAIRMIKRFGLKRVVLIGDSIGTEKNPGGDRSMLTLRQEDLAAAGIDWQVDLIQLYAGHEEGCEIPEYVYIIPESEKTIVPPIGIYEAVINAKRGAVTPPKPFAPNMSKPAATITSETGAVSAPNHEQYPNNLTEVGRKVLTESDIREIFKFELKPHQDPPENIIYALAYACEMRLLKLLSPQTASSRIVSEGNRDHFLYRYLLAIFLQAEMNAMDSYMQWRESHPDEADIPLTIQVFAGLDPDGKTFTIDIVNNGMSLEESENSAQKRASREAGKPRAGGNGWSFENSRRELMEYIPESQVIRKDQRDRSGVVQEITIPLNGIRVAEVGDADIEASLAAQATRIGATLDEATLPAATGPLTTESSSVTTAEAVRIHEEDLKIEYMPVIPDKTILCHIVTDSIVPVEQRNILKVKLEQAMDKENRHIERVALLSGANANDPEAYIRDLESLMQKKSEHYRSMGYTSVRFDVACPSTELVSSILGKNMGVKAIAFEPFKNGEFYVVQAEGILLAMRALYSEDIDKLKAAFMTLSKNPLTGEQAAITNIDDFIRAVYFVLPATKIEDSAERRRIHDLIVSNIWQAA